MEETMKVEFILLKEIYDKEIAVTNPENGFFVSLRYRKIDNLMSITSSHNECALRTQKVSKQWLLAMAEAFKAIAEELE